MEIRKIYESFAEDLDIPLRDSSEYNLKYNELSRLIKQVSDKELAKKLEDGVQELSEAVSSVSSEAGIKLGAQLIITLLKD
ncbi:hypothetical protein [Ruminococcus sp. Marseille-P6503]|jgi:hypothetical protein|uniref:hypothetical protein n=1 Tax=Ruminococcus sp. Marseille-P6503 TaxID=2364796 RepID=UPI000F547726|nr:hypothetical protein [Ruminococcus sp. Marseille-P6503]